MRGGGRSRSPVRTRATRDRRARRPVACAGRLGASCSREGGRLGAIGRRRRPSQHKNEVNQNFATFQGGCDVVPLCVPAPWRAPYLVTLAPAALEPPDWPNRSIVAVSTVSAGNAADTVARIVLDQVSKQIGQSFVIENRTGAGGTIGSASAAKADPDGYTILLLTASQGSAVALYKVCPTTRCTISFRSRCSACSRACWSPHRRKAGRPSPSWWPPLLQRVSAFFSPSLSGIDPSVSPWSEGVAGVVERTRG